MLSLKASAIPKGLTAATVLAIIIAEEVHKDMGFDMVITSLNDSKHKESSYHYSGNAFDTRVRGPNWNTANYPDAAQCEKLREEAKRRLGPCYDVVYENDHLHWEFNARIYG